MLYSGNDAIITGPPAGPNTCSPPSIKSPVPYSPMLAEYDKGSTLVLRYPFSKVRVVYVV